MTETLLSPSNVLLFGRVMADIEIAIPRITPTPSVKVTLLATKNIVLDPYPTSGVDGVAPKAKQRVLLSKQTELAEIGVYVVKPQDAPSIMNYYLDPIEIELNHGKIVRVKEGTNKGFWKISVGSDGKRSFEKIATPIKLETHNPFSGERKGANRLLQDQIAVVDESKARTACFARIYGFSYEGQYFDLSRPMLFLVHGDGEPATELSQRGVRKPSRAPGDPSLTGLAAAEFEFADDVRVWSYDKADYTIRMDVETGMFEQVLLDAFFSGGGGGGVSGAMVSGAMVSGAMVGGSRGAMVRGAMVSGAMLRGRRGGRGDPSD